MGGLYNPLTSFDDPQSAALRTQLALLQLQNQQDPNQFPPPPPIGDVSPPPQVPTQILPQVQAPLTGQGSQTDATSTPLTAASVAQGLSPQASMQQAPAQAPASTTSGGFSPVPPSFSPVAPPQQQQQMPQTPDELQAARDVVRQRMEALQKTADQISQYHPSLGKRILMGALGAFAGMGPGGARTGYEVARAGLQSPLQAQYDRQQEQLKQAQETLKTEAEIKRAESTAWGPERIQLEYDKLNALNQNRLDVATLKEQGYETRLQATNAEKEKLQQEAEALKRELQATKDTDQMARLQAQLADRDKLAADADKRARDLAKERDAAAESRAKIAAQYKEETQKGTQFRATINHFGQLRKEAQDNAGRANQALANFEARNPGADKGAVELFLSTISRRMAQGGITYVGMPSNKWEKLISDLNDWLGTGHEHLPEEYRKELMGVMQRYQQFEGGVLDIINGAGQQASAPGATANDIQNIQTRADEDLGKFLTGRRSAAPLAPLPAAPSVGPVSPAAGTVAQPAVGPRRRLVINPKTNELEYQ